MTGSAPRRSRSSWTVRGRYFFLYDMAAIALAVLGAFALRFDNSDLGRTLRGFMPVALIPIVVQLVANVGFRLYRREWRYASVRDLVTIAAAVITGAVMSEALILVLVTIGAPSTRGLPRSFVPLTAMLSLLLVGGGRFLARILADSRERGAKPDAGLVRSLVYGAGEAGAAIARFTDRDLSMGVVVVGFVDDDPAKRGSRLLGRPIKGRISELASIAADADAQQLIVAMPSAPGRIIRGAVRAARDLDLEVRIVPGLQELLGAPDRAGRLRPVSVEDLLRREPVKVDFEELAGYVNGASVIVTGAGGSIGSELARQVARLGPRRLVLVDNSETALWAIDRDLRDRSAVESIELVPVIADIRSAAAIGRVFAEHGPEVVFHAAAMKHVPICEIQPAEAALTNVIGTRNLIRASEAAGIRRFVLISTDKAVHPVSIMGATKRWAELMTLEAGRGVTGSNIAVRFGNVLGSSGSVVPIFRRQLELGLPITITHPDTTRYFMTIPEAVSLILQAGATDASREIYILDMGEPVRIVDLAEDMIRLSGLDPDTVEIAYTGLRPGERLEERLFYDHENIEKTAHDRVWRVTERPRSQVATDASVIDELERLCRAADDQGVRRLLQETAILGAGSPVASRSS